MKTLYLVRHAKSSWDYPELSDYERPLNKRGKRDAPEMGQRLASKGITPDLMLSSPANRALTTCETIAQEIDYPKNKIITNEDIYHASKESLLEILKDVDDKYDSIMMFGHNPGFTDFANELADTDIVNIPTCGLFACTFPLDSWNYIEWSSAHLLFYDYPKKK